MKIIKNRVRIELSQREKEIFAEMVAFTRKYYEENNKCNDLKCSNCPLNIFCGSEDQGRTVQNAIDQIEDHLNGC